MLPSHTNRLLDSMSEDSQARLNKHMERVELNARARLEEGDRHVPYVYFVLSGVVSLVYRGRVGDQVDVGLIGYEGCTGCSIILGCERTPQATTVQCRGEAFRISVGSRTRSATTVNVRESPYFDLPNRRGRWFTTISAILTPI